MKETVRMQNQFGVVMNISGFALVYMMKITHSTVRSAKLKKAQTHWMSFMPKKLLLSLTLTPLTVSIKCFNFDISFIIGSITIHGVWLDIIGRCSCEIVWVTPELE